MNRELTSAQLWTVGAVLLCLVVAIFIWFGAVDPKRNAAQTLNSQVESTETTLNHLLGAPRPAEPSQGALQAIVQELPSTADQPGLLTLLSSDAVSSHASIQSVSFPGLNGTSGTAGTASGSGGQATTAASSNGNRDGNGGGNGDGYLPQLAQIPGLQPVQMQLTVEGNYGEIETFIQGLQNAPRVMEIFSVSFQNSSSSGLASASSVAQITVDAFTSPQSAQLQVQANR